MREKVVLTGGGGHCKVVIDAIRKEGIYEIFGITDLKNTGSEILGIKIIGTDDILEELLYKGITSALITLGHMKCNTRRVHLFNKLCELGFSLINVLHPGAIIGEEVSLGKGNVILAGSIINSCTSIGSNCIINTGSIVEHDCIIENHVHISPGVNLAGGVKVGENTHIGMGADVIEGVTIGKNCIIGAGAVVIGDIPHNSVAVGIPAKVIKEV